MHKEITRAAYADGSNDADRELLVEPNLHRRALLKKPEQKVDRGKQNAATAAATSSGHFMPVWIGCAEDRRSERSLGRTWSARLGRVV